MRESDEVGEPVDGTELRHTAPRVRSPLADVGGASYPRGMEIVLVPGLWLTASSWDTVADDLTRSGHRPRALTLPGVGIVASGSAHLGIADWIADVTRVIDQGDEPVVLVGHSGGGNVVWGAADARPERVARVILVDTFAPTDGAGIWEFAVVDGVVPFPGWASFDEVEVADLDVDARRRADDEMLSVPARIPTDPISLHDDRRHGIPVTVVTCTLSADDLRATLAGSPPWAAEMNAIDDLEIVELPGGHWPQFAQPHALASAIDAAIR